MREWPMRQKECVFILHKQIPDDNEEMTLHS